MARQEKFKYNPETLSYEKVEVSFTEKLLKSLLIIAPAIVLGFLFQFIFSFWFTSPYEKKLVRENTFLKAQVEEIEDEFSLSKRVLEDIEKRDNEIYRVVFNTDKFPDEFRNLGTGGSDEFEDLKGYDASDKVIEMKRQLKIIEKRIYAQSISFDEVTKLAKDKENMLGCVPAIQPVANKDLDRIASGYGWRIDPIYKTQRMHWGLDFTAPTGTNVYASGNGIVCEVEEKMWGYGKCIVIDHGYGYKSRYAHLSAFEVKLGQKVTRGQLIGYVGSTGKSTAPHLHYEVEKNGMKVDPIHFFHSDLSPDDYEKLIEMSKNANISFD